VNLLYFGNELLFYSLFGITIFEVLDFELQHTNALIFLAKLYFSRDFVLQSTVESLHE